MFFLLLNYEREREMIQEDNCKIRQLLLEILFLFNNIITSLFKNVFIQMNKSKWV